MLIFRDDALDKICCHAQNEYPKECCGIMLGKRQSGRRIVHKIIHTRNMMDEGQNTTRFLINPIEIVKVELLAEEEELEIVGFYHSHPDYEAVVSNADILHMIEGYSYAIASVRNGKCVKVNSFEKTVQTDTDATEEMMSLFNEKGS